MGALAALAALVMWALRPSAERPASEVVAKLSTTSIASDNPKQPAVALEGPAIAAPAQSAPVASSSRPPASARLDRNGARLAMQAVLDSRDCKLARSESWPRYWAVRTGVAWLPADEQALARAAVHDGRQRLLAACRRQGLSEIDDTAGKLRPASLEQALNALAPQMAAAEQTIEQAANAGDREAQLLLQASRRPAADVDRDVRPLLNAVLADVVAGADPGLLVGIGRIPAMESGPDLGRLASWYRLQQTTGRPNAAVNQRALWTLVACDLGMDCGASSPTLDRLCVLQGLCGYPDVEAALRDGVIRRVEAAETEARRHWAVERIRSGQIAGMFDPAPQPRGDGP